MRRGSLAANTLGIRRPLINAPAVLLGALLAAALSAQVPDPPFDIRALRGTQQQRTAQVRDHYARQIPQEAYLPDGSVNTQNPEWQQINQQHTDAQANLRKKLKTLDQRDRILGQAKETSGARLRDTGSPPKTFEPGFPL